jgi:hypothetical protein
MFDGMSDFGCVGSFLISDGANNVRSLLWASGKAIVCSGAPVMRTLFDLKAFDDAELSSTLELLAIELPCWSSKSIEP